MTVAMSRIVIRPINELAIAARRVGQGNFDARACVDSRDELGQLGAAFNEMTERLAQAYRDLEGKNSELASALQEVHESRQRLALLEQLKGELAKFVPDSVKRLLEQNPNATELEKKTVDVAVLFLDIAGYTKLSEQLEPKKLNQLVQLYFSSFLEIIQAHHGDVNETAGDGLMVIFQADRTTGDHSVNATRAAFAIRQRVGTLNEEYGGVFPAIQLHMGINSGEALVGATKLGGAGSERWTFTASGPTTNIAARPAGSATGGEIIVGPSTAVRIRHARNRDDVTDEAKRVRCPTIVIHARDDALVPFAEGRLLALRTEIWHDKGAYIRPTGVTVAEITLGILPGPYRLGAYEGISVATYTEMQALLKRWGIPVSPHNVVFDSIDEVIAFAETWSTRRNTLDF